jgi:hypothetical protein
MLSLSASFGPWGQQSISLGKIWKNLEKLKPISQTMGVDPAHIFFNRFWVFFGPGVSPEQPDLNELTWN